MSNRTLCLKDRVSVYAGDCFETIKTLADNSIDACVCDPPYALTSIVKRFGPAANGHVSTEPKTGATGAYARAAKGFMGQAWDNGCTAFSVDFWTEVWRVLKPGAHVVAFGATRSYHRLAVAIEDAGFEIRDQLAWVYGTGFNKKGYILRGDDGEPIGPWGGALKPAWEPICFARKSLSEKTIAANLKRWGVGAINVDACRIEADWENDPSRRGFGYGFNNDGYSADCIVGNAPVTSRSWEPKQGRWPANIVHDGSNEVVSLFPDTQSVRQEVTSKPGSVSVNGAGLPSHTGVYGFDDSGSAARFFYSAKADSDDRLGSRHPTIKPVDLMQWLCRLVTPKGGTILDPFAGSGSTGEAAWREGFNAILCEREIEYLGDIDRRMKLCLAGPDERARESIKARLGDVNPNTGPLFDWLDRLDAKPASQPASQPAKYGSGRSKSKFFVALPIEPLGQSE